MNKNTSKDEQYVPSRDAMPQSPEVSGADGLPTRLAPAGSPSRVSGRRRTEVEESDVVRNAHSLWLNQLKRRGILPTDTAASASAEPVVAGPAGVSPASWGEGHPGTSGEEPGQTLDSLAHEPMGESTTPGPRDNADE